MLLNSSELAEDRDIACAVIIDFAAQKAARFERRLDAAAPAAALALGHLRAERGDWRSVAAALVAPFNP